MNELPAPLHLVPQLAHRSLILAQRIRHKVERHVLPEDLVVRQPDALAAGGGHLPAQDKRAGQLLSLAE